MTVSLAVIVFAFSLNTLSDERRWKSNIDALVQVNFLDYDTYVKKIVRENSAPILNPIAERIRSEINSSRNHILLLNRITDKLASPLHVGKIKLNEFGLDDISAISLNDFSLINQFGARNDIQFVIPDTDNLPQLLNEFFDKYRGKFGYVGGSISTVRGELETSDAFNTFLQSKGESPTVKFSFRLSGARPTEPPASFETNFSVKIRTISNSSFLHWVKQNKSSTGIVNVQDSKIVFGDDLTDLPERFRKTPLQSLSTMFAERIEAAGPEGRSVSILGIDVPGTMIALASPLTLLFLLFYFAHHVRHLSNIVVVEPLSVRQFAWLPIALDEGWPKSWTWMRQHMPAWRLEAFFISVALPVTSLVLLYAHLEYFSDFMLWPALMTVTAICGLIGFGLLSVKYIRKIRHLLQDLTN